MNFIVLNFIDGGLMISVRGFKVIDWGYFGKLWVFQLMDSVCEKSFRLNVFFIYEVIRWFNCCILDYGMI